ncbi:Protein NRT1/ PTR FAMILY 5.6 [Vigna angularis]|uniref:Protein NRT1/ PTR FAMILY 5.6 n=1 Tax=Phaseolus angularis TaxID=3914 RepID=A0A8T0L407_PHAAN|nr:Protein NRT1/ PTR FAMILY 5.6 [Vigna angularis]
MEQEIEKKKRDKSEDEKWVHDASVDYKNRVPLRSSTGAWKAALFVLMMHEDLKTATKNVNYWLGATTLMPLIGGFVSDAYTGRFHMIIFSSLVYLKGISLLTMSQLIPSLKPCNNEICDRTRKVHEVVFFLALYCIALATGGFRPSLQSFGADQFDDDHLEERKKKMSFFNWWSFTLCSGMVFGVQEDRRKPFNANSSVGEFPVEDTEEKENPWRLATVTRVEETKLIVNVVPIWLTTLIIGVCIAQSQTLFVKQAAAMNLNIGHNFKIPAASMVSVTAICTMISVPTYDKIIVPVLRKVTGNERGISILRRIGIGLTLLLIIMVVAALVERKRLRMVGHEVVTEGGRKHETMSVLWLVPQYLMIGIGGDTLSIVGLQEYFYDQVPDSMRSLGIALYLSVFGVGYFLSSFLIIIVDNVTGKNGKSWIAKDINSSRLDLFYWLLAIINALNLCLFIFLAKRYTYKTVQRKNGN